MLTGLVASALIVSAGFIFALAGGFEDRQRPFTLFAPHVGAGLMLSLWGFTLRRISLNSPYASYRWVSTGLFIIAGVVLVVLAVIVLWVWMISHIADI